VEILGKLLNFDLNMSPFRNEACGFCHMPYVAFSGPIPSVNLTMIGYPGTLHYRAGKRTSVHEYDAPQGAFFGGNFWDARSTGYKLQSADAEQAQHPPVDTRKWVFPTRLASRFGYRKQCTGPCLSWFGALISTPDGRATPRRSAPPRGEQQGSAAAPRQFG
jgi:hypothetical protein